jgi:hypothetical protein
MSRAQDEDEAMSCDFRVTYSGCDCVWCNVNMNLECLESRHDAGTSRAMTLDSLPTAEPVSSC